MKKAKIFAIILVIAQVLSICVLASDDWYPDVKESRWSYADIKYVSDNGLMNGVDGGKFDPAGKITRGMVVTVLYRYEGSPKMLYSGMFTDVKEGKWFTDAVLWAGRNEIVNGVGNNKYAPNDNVTREQLAAIIYRFAEYKGIDTSKKSDIKGYADYSKIHDYARDALAWTNETGLIKGVTDTELNPRGTATREQFAAIIHRFDTTEFDLLLAYNLPTAHSHYTEKEYPLVEDAEFYVAVDGNDSGKGTKDDPFATFERAKLAVRDYKTTHTGPITVAFKAGNYGKAGFTFDTALDSGTEDTPITYCAYGDGPVIFDNGVTVPQSAFTKLDEADKKLFDSAAADHIYKAKLSDYCDVSSLPESVEAFCNGMSCITARYPNVDAEGYDVFSNASMMNDEKSITLLPFVAKRVAKYHTLEGVRLNGYLKYDWGSDNTTVEGFDPATSVMTLGEMTWGIGNEEPHKFILYNISEELDYAGEYYVDRSTGTLYVYEPESDYSICVYGNFINTSCSYTTFRGFDFRNCTGRAVTMIGDHLTLDRSTIMNCCGDVTVRLGGSYITISNCEISNMLSGGIYIVGSGDDAVTFRDSHILIDNNAIHDFGIKSKSYASGVGVDGGIDGVTVSHNEVYNCPHVAISYGGVNVYEYNVIHDAVRESSDMGAFYTGRSLTQGGCIIRYNLFYKIGKSMAPTCIYLDDGLSGQEIYGNIFYGEEFNSTVLMGGGRQNSIHDNITIGTGSEPRGLWILDKYYTMAQEAIETYNANKAQYEAEGKVPADLMSDTYQGRLQSLDRVPYQTDPEWIERFPWLLTFDFDITHLDNPDCLANSSYCNITNNYVIGGKGAYNEVADSVVRFGTVGNNKVLSIEENELFVDPARGDYNIRDGADFMKIPFSDIGRY